MTLAAAVLVGLAAGLLVGGLRGLRRARWRWAPLALLGLAIQIVLFQRDAALVAPLLAYAPALHLASYGLVGLSLAANWRLDGVPLILVGAALNAAVIGANGGQMPRAAAPDPVPFANVAPITDDTVLGWLGDWIDFPVFPGRLYSPGDMLIALGGGIAAFRLANPRSSRPPVVILGRRSA